jgi:hypothetical protein
MSLGRAASEYWSANHSYAVMAADYRRVMAEALSHPSRPLALPEHLVNSADDTLRTVLHTFDVPLPFAL